jgi:hypothetical protein
VWFSHGYSARLSTTFNHINDLSNLNDTTTHNTNNTVNVLDMPPLTPVKMSMYDSDSSSEMSDSVDLSSDISHTLDDNDPPPEFFDSSDDEDTSNDIDPSLWVFDLLGLPVEIVERVILYHVKNVGIVEAWKARGLCSKYWISSIFPSRTVTFYSTVFSQSSGYIPMREFLPGCDILTTSNKDLPHNHHSHRPCKAAHLRLSPHE